MKLDVINYDKLLIFMGKWLTIINTNIKDKTNEIKIKECITLADLFHNDFDNCHINYQNLFKQLIIDYIYDNGFDDLKYITIKEILETIETEKITQLMLLYKLYQYNEK